MSERPFVHLHCHTDYSLLDGACDIKKLMAVVESQKMPAVAMTDHGNLFGAVEFYNEAASRGIHPIIGCEVYVSQQGHKLRSESDRYNHLLLLSETQEGYKNLIRLVSTGYLEGFYYKPRIDKDLLSQHSRGLIAMSACLRGDINETLLAERYEEAKRLANEYADLFGRSNFFLEMQNHSLDQDKIVLPQIRRISTETGIPLVASNDAHYLTRDDVRAHEILLCIQTGKTMSDANRMRFATPDFYVKSRAEMMTLFGEVEDALDRTWDIAQRCQVKLEKVKDPFPRFDVPQGHTSDTYFAWVAREGFEKRRPRLEAMRKQGYLKHDLPEYVARLESEIQMIQQMKFSSYFLIVWDFIRFAKLKGIPVGPGRGSAAGSLVAYAMEITDIDPLQYGLLFERFLNPERISMPDIDIDFCTRGRGAVIQYVTEKYGREQVAQIITFGTLAAKAAIKDVGRVLDMSFAEVDRISKLVPRQLNIKLKDAIQDPELNELASKEPRIKEVLDISLKLEGVSRNAGMHAAGVVISSLPLMELVPLFVTNKDEIVTQYDMIGLEKLGLLKMDFLGLTTLTIIADAVKLIEQYRGEKIVPENLPLDDAETYAKIFSTGLTSGVFQFESPGMKDVLRRYQPNRIEDLCALNALYRPGPIQGGMIPDFIDRKHGRKPVTYDLPELKEILEETYGVIVYQEQVIQISNRLAGYSLGEADVLRRAMGKKNVLEMAMQRESFIKRATERGYPPKRIAKIFDFMQQFAGYGFTKSHSAAYAYLAYVTAYLKTHYSVEFMSALLTSEAGNTDKIVKYINECREMGIPVLPPDVNESNFDFTPVNDAIRFGLGAVKNVGQGAVQAIVEARQDGGRFSSIYNFCERVNLNGVNRRVMESLIKAGAFDSTGANRAQLTEALDRALESGMRASRDRAMGQHGLFGFFAGDQKTEHPLANLPDWTMEQKLAGEKEVLGIYVSGHPLDRFKDKVAELATHSTDTLEDLERNTTVALCGILTNIVRKTNREGKYWASLKLEDGRGTADAMIFANRYEDLLSSLREDAAVFVRGSVLPEESGPPKISVQEMVRLEDARLDLPSLISIRIWLKDEASTEKASALNELFGRKRGETEVRLRLEKPRDFSVIMDVTTKVRPDREFQAEIEKICGPESMQILAN
ncbi:MAG: DNA polymerase III subunit alpha [Acidobacteriaceae bacterium]|nr:DNA polymerase III subunit alpha [Acidobacteriaceae bacterium]MBV9779441.1 DNA polymerase III subunit alpha [Acidobacteriaceae bacterium]